MSKVCSKCNKEKDLSEFHKEKKGKFGVRAECKGCTKRRHRTYDSKEKYQKWVQNNKEKGNVVYWNMRAWKVNDRYKRRYGITEKLSGQDLHDKFSKVTSCCYCGTSIAHDDCHIEHIVPAFKGGPNTIDNIDFSCGKCNTTKGTRTDKEFFDYIKSIYNHLKHKYEKGEDNTEPSHASGSV